MSPLPLAVAGSAPLAFVDDHGYVHFADGWRAEWWVLGDDYWHVPAASSSVRQRCVDNAPVTETAIRVPGGDVLWRVAAAIGPDGPTIVAECENTASIPVAVGVALVSPTDEVSLQVHPVTHTSTWRGALREADSSSLPDLASVARGWLALARQGAQVELGDVVMEDELISARCRLLLQQGELVALGKRASRQRAAAVADALTLLGYDDEAGAVRRSTRLRPARKGLALVGYAVVGDAAAESVAAIRRAIVRDDAKVIDVLPEFDESWRGRSVDIRNLPTNHGVVSFALRWHGDVPAILWEVAATKPVEITASSIDPTFSTLAASGEVLLQGATRRG